MKEFEEKNNEFELVNLKFGAEMEVRDEAIMKRGIGSEENTQKSTNSTQTYQSP